MSLKYRPEIDGLRAIAVLAVLFYHAEFEIFGLALLGGGFIGVDIFFVISGYLITSIVQRQLLSRSFSFKNFYERRARRILPALFFVMFSTIPLAWVWMLPTAIKEYAGSALSSLFFSSNFWFFLEDSYTAEPSALKPLLHTWSLSVEEQFYLIFPFVLLLLRKLSFWRMFVVLGGILLLSLLWAAEEGAASPNANFFMISSRAWELLAGALLATLEVKYGRVIPHSKLSKLMPVFGFALILNALIFFEDSMGHPGWMTALPIAGTMLVLWFAQPIEWVTRVLSSKALVSLGLISYSLYLWHVPIFAFARLKSESELNDISKILILLFSFMLTLISFFGVEKPFRKKEMATKRVMFILGSGFVLLVAFFSMVVLSDGAAYRLSGAARTAYEHFRIPEYKRLQSTKPGRHFKTGDLVKICNRRDPMDACEFIGSQSGVSRFVTLGDSHVGHYEMALKERLDAIGEGMISLAYEQCPPLPSSMWLGNVAECVLVNDRRNTRIESFTGKKIFLISAETIAFESPKARTKNPMRDGKNGVDTGTPLSEKEAFDGYKNSIQQLLKRGHTVVLLHAVPRPHADARQVFFDALRTGERVGNDPKVSQVLVDFDDEYRWAELEDSKIAQADHPNLIRIYPRDILCPEDTDQRCILVAEDGAIYNTGRHLSIVGARMVMDSVFEALRRRGDL